MDKSSQSLGFALSSTDLINLLARFYPTATARSTAAPAPNGFGTVAITSVPDGADVYVDGQFVGNTPETLELTVGPHRIRLAAHGQKDWERSMDILKDSQLSLKAQLTPSNPDSAH